MLAYSIARSIKKKKMATDVRKIIDNLLAFYDFTNQTIISVGAGGGQFIEYGRHAKSVFAVDNDQEALVRLEDNLQKSQLAHKFTLIHSDFYQVNLKGDVVLFEFCLHEMENPEAAIRHAMTLAPNVIIADHSPCSEWAYIVDEREKVTTSTEAIALFPVKKSQQHDSVQLFQSYDELFQKVSVQGEKTIERIKDYKEQQDITIPMSYSFTQL
jgi:predicted RNA methylase